MSRFGVRRCLVAGGSGGIGGAVVRAMARAGDEVVFLYHRGERVSAALSRQTGARALRLDITDGEAVSRAIGEEIYAHGGFDLLVNAAGTASFSLLQDTRDEEWARVLAVNLTGPFYCCKAVLPAMLAQQWGRIVNISSVWGVTGSACEVAYSAAKAGLIGLTRALAAEVAPSGVTVNAIAPGVIDTQMNAPLGEAALQDLIERTPVGRLGTPEEVASLVLFLCREEAAFITGEVIGQTGGFPR